jgi:hypothetical protein
MKTSELTGGDLRRAVYETIRRELGAAALVRFVQENHVGKGDYSQERQKLRDLSVEELKRALAHEKQAAK